LCSPRTPRPPISTLFPYTTLFRSGDARSAARHQEVLVQSRCRFDRTIDRWSEARGDRTEGHRRVEHVVVEGEVAAGNASDATLRSEEHTSELQSRENLVCRLLLEK